jgi:uncharacterized phosphosugar-binding protein
VTFVGGTCRASVLTACQQRCAPPAPVVAPAPVDTTPAAPAPAPVDTTPVTPAAAPAAPAPVAAATGTGVWRVYDWDGDKSADLIFIKYAQAGTNSVEVHVSPSCANFQSRLWESGSTFAQETDGQWTLADWDLDGKPDLVFIKTSNCGTNSVEVHIATAASGYQTRVIETGTTFAQEQDGVWKLIDCDGDNKPDLVFIKTSNCGTNTVEVHIASAASNFQTRILETGTTFAQEQDGTWTFADYDGDGKPDLCFIKTSNCGTNTVEVHVASAASNFQTRVLETGTTFAQEEDGSWRLADYDKDGKLDLYFVKINNTPNGHIEVHVASGASNFQTRVIETATTFVSEGVCDQD